ncbi:MAG: M28 family peptidase [Candidatus Aenigmarchaeota archaeon]|nr:M28 family peptidase [Candidatus Aenigmarchaeota archaeon]
MAQGKRAAQKTEGDVLTGLISFFGVSGSESGVRKYIEQQIRPYVDEISVDRMGNLVARKRGKGPKVMLAAHMDEIGLMVKRMEERGFIYCTAIGGIDPAAFVGNPVHLAAPKGRIHGFLTTHEVSAGKYIQKVPTIEDIFIDTGLTRTQLQQRGVEIGTYVHLESHTCCEGEGGIVLGKALDNRIGCYILIELAKALQRPKADVYFVFTVQEEFGMFGARTSAFQLDPDWGIAVDTTYANDVFADPSRSIGKGPVITVKDGEFIANPCVVGWLKATARKQKIPFQLEATESGTTDASTIQTVRGGVPTGALSIAVRNIHTTSGLARMGDIRDAVRLLAALLRDPPKVCPV